MKVKIFEFILIILAILPQTAYCQDNMNDITKADSLFNAEHYSKALHLYERTVKESENYPPYILLRLAFIHEKFHNYATALYNLNLFFKLHPHSSILKKMDELAEKQRIKGYQYNDLDYFVYLYLKHYKFIIKILLGFTVLLFIYLLVKKIKKEALALRPFILFITSAIILLILNYDITPSKAIIRENGTCLMSAPSAGSDLIAIIGNGHRVTIKDKEDIWFKIIWEGKEVYVNEHKLLMIESFKK